MTQLAIEFLAVAEAAGRLGCSIRRVHQLAADGKLAGAVKIGGCWKIPAEGHPSLCSPAMLEASKTQTIDGLKGVAAPKREEAIRCLGLINEFEKFAAAYKREGKRQIIALRAFSTQKQIPVRTMQRWIAAYKDEGLSGLVDLRGRPKNNDVISPDAWELFKSMYLTQQRLSVKMCRQNICFFSRDQGLDWKIPSLNVMYRFIASAIPKFVEVLHRKGLAAYEAQCAPFIVTDPDSIAPGQIWVGDHAEFNCWVRHRNQWFRPWVTAWMDMRSRLIVGWHISTSPNQTTILLAAKNAVDKYGLPESVKVDNGRDYDSQMWTGVTKKQRRALGRGYLDEQWLAGLWGYLSVAVSFAIPYHPQSKGVLERWFDTVDEQFTKTIPTYAGKRSELKPDDLVERLKDPMVIATAYKLDHLEQLFARYVETYNHSIHTGWGMNQTPMQLFATRTTRRALQEGVTDLLMRVWSPELTVGKNGVNFKGLYFGQYDIDLLACFGKKVRCAYDPADLSRVYVYDATTLKLVTIAEQAQLVRYGAGVDEETLREAQTQKSKAVKIARQYRDASLTSNMDLTDLAIRSREMANSELRIENEELNATQAAIEPVITPLNNQVREHKRQETIKAVRRAAGGEAITHVLDIDLSLLKPEKQETNLKLFDNGR